MRQNRLYWPGTAETAANTSPGDHVRIAECRPLSKTISFVIIEKR